MLKTSAIAVCVLALSGSAALAQSSWWNRWIPSGPTDAPYGANGPAARSVGGDPNVNHTFNGRTSSSSMSRADMKWDSAHGASSTSGGSSYVPRAPQYGYQAQAPAQYQRQQVTDEPAGGPHRVYITDEHGFRYDSKGRRLDSRGYVIR